MLSLQHTQRPNRILNRYPASNKGHETEHRRPSSMHEHVQQRLLHRPSVEDDAMRGRDRGGGDAEDDVQDVYLYARVRNDDSHALV
jgi:hypothetical protein